MRIGSLRRRHARRALALALLVQLAAQAASAQSLEAEQRSYPVTSFVLEYALENPAQPPLSELEAIPLEFRVGRGGLLPPHPATRNERFPLGQVPPGSRFYTAGLRHLSSEILAVFQARGIDGVLVTFPEIDAKTGRDLRPGGRGPLRVRIWTGRVENVATVADGDRFGGESQAARTNREEHRFIREGSPVQPGGPKGLLRVREIEDYAFRLSRHPGRRVDALLRPGELPGSTRVDYHVAESKPWLVYAQLSNTGTKATTRLRERFGISDDQLTGRDDVLQLDYVTGDFDQVNGVFGRYEAPVISRLSPLHVEGFGSWSQYDASEVGVASVDAQGEQWEAGGRLLLQVFQYRELFVDLFAGASWRNVSVDNTTNFGGAFDTKADEDFFLAEGGLRVRRHTGISSAALDVTFDHNLASVAGTDREQLILLGSRRPDVDFSRLRWQGALSIYLEPALRWRRWANPSTPASSTLAHELLLVTQGQLALGDRLIPQFQQIAGGMYTVRGYEQAVTAGDTVAIVSGEYRLHLPRLLLPSREVPTLPVLGKVRIRPEQVYGRPDWDLIAKAFVDAARVVVTRPDRAALESDQTLVAVGVGAELQFLKNFTARVDVAWPQRRLELAPIHRPEIHAALTVMY